MQSQDENGNVKQFTEIDFSKLDELRAQIKSAEDKGAVSHTIGNLPKAGKIILIEGFKYRVEFADFVKGKYKVTMVCMDK